MANYNPFAEKREEQTIPEQNWFLKTATKAAALTGTAAAAFGLWKIAGPARKILEKSIDNRIKNQIAKDQYKAGDHFGEFVEGWTQGEAELRADNDLFRDADVNVWKSVDTPPATLDRIGDMERGIVRKLEEDASYLSPTPVREKLKTGMAFTEGDWFALNKKKTVFQKKTVSLEGFEAEQLARLRQLTITEYLEKYGYTSVEESVEDMFHEMTKAADFFSDKEYFDTDHIRDGYGAQAIDRVTTVHESYLKDKRYADLYKKNLTRIHRRYVLQAHSYKRAKVDKPIGIEVGGGYRRYLYGDVVGEVIDPKMFLEVKPKVQELFNSRNPGMRLRNQITSMGSTPWSPSNRFSVLQQTNYTGYINNINKTLMMLREEGHVKDFGITMVDYGTATNPDKRLRISLVHNDNKYANQDFQIELRIGVDGRLGGATPGLQQVAERFHIVGDAYGAFDNFKVVNTTEMNLMDLDRMLRGSMVSGGFDSFTDNPLKFIRQVNRTIDANIAQNAGVTGGIYDLLNAMSVDNPALRDLLDASRPRHNSAMRTAQNFVVSSRNTQYIANLKKDNRAAVVINFDLETLDSTTASPGKSILSSEAQITKYGITVQDTLNARVIDSFEESNWTGYNYFQSKETGEAGTGWNSKLRKWLREGVLPNGKIGTEVEDYKALLEMEGARTDLTNRKQVVQSMANKLEEMIRMQIKKGKSPDDIFIGVKNGWNFDLKAFEIDAPGFLDKKIGNRTIREMVIDVQALHSFRNNALGENNALNIERVNQALMGRLGIPEMEAIRGKPFHIGTDQGVKNVLMALNKKALNVNGKNFQLLDWDMPFKEDAKGRRMVMRAHGSPRVDAALTGAFIMEQVADYTASSDYLDTADYIANLLEMQARGPMTPDNLLTIYRYLNEKVLKGYGVASFSASSQGMVNNLVANMVHINELSPLADPMNIGVRRRLAGKWNLGLSRHYLKRNAKGNPRVYREYLGRFMTTSAIEDAEAIMTSRIAKADEAANEFSNSILAKGIYLLEPETEPTIALKRGLMRRYEARERVTITTDSLSGDSLVNARLIEFQRQVDNKAKEIAKKQRTSVTPEMREAAEREVSERMNLILDFESDLVSAGKYGGEVALPKKMMKGKVVSVAVERDKTALGKTSIQRLIYKLEYTLGGGNLFRGAQIQMAGSHAVAHEVKTISESAAAGFLGMKDFEFLATAEFFKKGHIGATKEVMLSYLLKKLYIDAQTGSDPATREKAEKLANEIGKELNATVDIRRNKFIVNTKNREGAVDQKMRILGDIDAPIQRITEWYRRAGIVWNKQEIANLHDQGYNFDLHRQYSDKFKEVTKLTNKELREKYEAFKQYTDEEVDFARQELVAMEKLFTVDATNPQNSVKMFLPVQVAGEKFKLGIAAYDTLSIYGNDLNDITSRDSIFRQDYYLGLRHTHHGKDKTTMDYFARHTFGSRYDAYKSVVTTMKVFTDQMFSQELTRTPLGINELNFLLDLKTRIQRNSVKSGMGSSKTWGDKSAGQLAAAKRDRERMMDLEGELMDPMARQRIEGEISSITEALSKKKGGEKIFQSMSRLKGYYSHEDVMNMSKLSKENNGVLVFKLPSLAGNAVEEIDIRETVRKFVGEITGQPHLTQGEIKNISEQLIFTLRDRLKDAKKDSPLSIDENGKLRMSALIMDWDPMPENLFTRISAGDAWLGHEQTEIKMNVLNSLHEWNRIVQTVKDPNTVNIAKEKFARMYVTYLMTGLPADATAKFWQAGQFNPPGLYGMAKNLDQLQNNVLTLKSTRPGSFKNFRQTLNQLTNARFDTVVISERAFRQFEFVTDEGEKINAARSMEKKLKELHGEDQGGAIFKDYVKGRKTLPGGLVYRHPIPQAGYDGLRTSQFLIVPKNLGDMIGMDDNSFFANPVFIGAQGGDFDGDRLFIHLKEIGMHYKFNEIAAAHEASFQEMINLPDVQDKLRKSQIELDERGNVTKRVKIGGINTVIGAMKDRTTVSTYNLKGERQYIDVATSMLDITDMTKHTVNFLEKLAGMSTKNANPVRLSSVYESTANTLISKNLIPITTNVLKTRVRDILSSPLGRKDPLKVMTFIGNLEHGIAGAAQSVIDIAKHPEDAARIAKLQAWLTTGVATTEARSYFMDMGREAMGSSFDEDLASATFDIFSGQIERIEDIRATSQEFKTARKQMLDFYMGRRNTTLFDAVSSWAEHHFSDVLEPSRPQRVLEQINDAFSTRLGRQVDLTPTFRKGGKYAAIGAAAFLGLSLFTPFGNSKSLNPLDMFVDIGSIRGQPAGIASPLEIPRSVPLNMVDASFSKEAFIKTRGYNDKKDRSNIISSMLNNSMLMRGDSIYEFKNRPYTTSSNYTKSINVIGTKELRRKYE